MQVVRALIAKLANSKSTVLITGESGTGKELAARAIHDSSPRRGESFVPVNCGAIPEELLESELFVHVRGAFTGGVNARLGRFQLANGGTPFLDEIGEMSPKLQVKLLRVLKERNSNPSAVIIRCRSMCEWLRRPTEIYRWRFGKASSARICFTV
jgi:transcriptional regulator with GAF, ATPase, and Fis domain